MSSAITGAAPAAGGLVLNNFLTKGGPGTLTLTGTNTFAGGIHVNGGLLAVNGQRRPRGRRPTSST